MSVQITGFVVKAQERYELPLKDKPVPRVKTVSGLFHIRSAAETFVDLYIKHNPGMRVWIEDLQANDGLRG